MLFYKSSQQPERIFIKVDNLSDPRLNKMTRIALLNPGNATVVVYDAQTKKYSNMTGVAIKANDEVMARLKSIFGDGNVVKR